MRNTFVAVAMGLALELPTAALGQNTGLPIDWRDVIELRIQNEPDMSGEYPVDRLGVAVFPRLGEIKVSQHTPETLQALLVEQYGRHLSNPSIDVIVRRWVRIGGAVRSGGFYSLDPSMTVREAVAMAGGPSSLGQEDKVWVFRDGKIVATIQGGTTSIADSPIRSGDQLFVAWVSAIPERKWISRNAGALGVALGGAAAVAIALIR